VTRNGRWRVARRRGALLAVAGFAARVLAAQGAPPELVTDRPDQTESAETVQRGAAQIEVGFTRTEAEAGEAASRVDELGATLVRVGLAADWELRVGWGGHVEAPDGGGAADGELGVKWRLGRSAGGGTTVALLAGTSVPVGASAVGGGRWDPELRLAVAHELAPALALGWNVGWAVASERDAGGGRRSPSHLFASAALGYAVSPRVGLFVELFGEGGGSRGGSPATSLDGGLTLRLRPNLQLDVAGGVGLSRAAPDRFVGVGLSLRLPR